MARKSPYTIERSAGTRKALEAVAGKYSSPYRDVVRAKVILYAAQGWSNEDIVARIDLPRQIVAKWRKRFYEEGLPGLQERARRGRPPVFSPRRRRRDQSAGRRPPFDLRLPLSRLHVPDIRSEAIARGLVASISDTTIWRWLSEDAIKPWQYRSWIFPRDPD